MLLVTATAHLLALLTIESHFGTLLTAACVGTPILLSNFGSAATHPKRSCLGFESISCSISAVLPSAALIAEFAFSNCQILASGLAGSKSAAASDCCRPLKQLCPALSDCGGTSTFAFEFAPRFRGAAC